MNNLSNKINAYIRGATNDFNQLALEIFAYQYQYCQPYQIYCNNLGKQPRNVSHWQDIPAVSTEVFREFALTTFPLTQAQYIFHTSGTSQQQPGKHYYADLSLYDAAIYSSFLAGIGLAHNQQDLTIRVLAPSFTVNPHSSLGYMLTKIIAWYGNSASKFYYNQYNLAGHELLTDLEQDCLQNRAVIIIGTAFALANFIDYLVAHNLQLQLPLKSRLLETGGLKGRVRNISRVELYHAFTHYLGLSAQLCFSEYGMTELSSQCYSLANSHHFLPPVWMPARIIDIASGKEVAVGETGLVQFFDMANVTAVSAIMTADLARREVQGFTLQGRAPQASLRGCSLHYET